MIVQFKRVRDHCHQTVSLWEQNLEILIVHRATILCVMGVRMMRISPVVAARTLRQASTSPVMGLQYE